MRPTRIAAARRGVVPMPKIILPIASRWSEKPDFREGKA
jgi:hypothetical protein